MIINPRILRGSRRRRSSGPGLTPQEYSAIAREAMFFPIVMMLGLVLGPAILFLLMYFFPFPTR